MARNRLPLDTAEWERQLVFWVVGLSPIVGAITAGAISVALHIRRGTFRRGNRVQILSGPHEGCLGIVRGTRTEVEKTHLVDEHYLTKEIIHISVQFEKGNSVLTEEFKEDELVKADFRSRWF